MEKKKGEIFQTAEVNKNTQIKEQKEKELKRDITPMFDYYKAWDKFAAEEEENLEKKPGVDDEEGEIIPAKNPTPEAEKVPKTQAEMMQRTSGAAPNTKIVIKGGSVKKNSMADQLK